MKIYIYKDNKDRHSLPLKHGAAAAGGGTAGGGTAGGGTATAAGPGRASFWWNPAL